MTTTILSTLCLLLAFIASTNAKSIYPPADYYEDGAHAPMCMRCHMAGTPQPGSDITVTPSMPMVVAGETITITAKATGFGNARPGIALHVKDVDKYPQRPPSEYGWVIKSGPGGKPYNYFRKKKGNAASLSWVMEAPRKPGKYVISASGYTANAQRQPGTRRSSTAAKVTVVRSSEIIAPLVVSAECRFEVYVFVSFSEAVDEVGLTDVSNYSIAERGGGPGPVVEQAFAARDNRSVVLKTSEHRTKTAYELTVRDVRDYASPANAMRDTTLTYAPDFSTPYKIKAQFAQDVTASKYLQKDRVEYLGRNGKKADTRINASFRFRPMTDKLLDKPVDHLVDVPLERAVLRLKQKRVTVENTKPEVWNVFVIRPEKGLNNARSVSEQWQGMKRGANPIATLSRATGTKASAKNNEWWEWDITEEVKRIYLSSDLGLEIRLMADSPSGSKGGVGFFGHDAKNENDRPHIALYVE